MKNLKHVGRLKTNNAKVLVVFRTLPGDPYYALVLGTSNLSDLYHNAIIDLVESDQGQDSNEFGQIMSIRYFPDGRSMLTALHQDGKLVKVLTTDVLMTPNTTTTIPLSELNMLIAEQKGVALDDLAFEATKETESEVKEVAQVNNLETAVVQESKEVVLEDTSASHLRSKADALYKEAAKLRKMADELDPPKKKVVKAKESADA
jgi:hypothetical protein